MPLDEKDKVKDYIDLYYPNGLEPDTRLYRTSLQERRRRKKYEEAKESTNYNRIFFPKLNQIFEGYYVFDMTDTDDNDCYISDVLLHRNQPILDDDIELMEALNGVRFDLMIYISVLAPYYFCFIMKHSYNSDSQAWTLEYLYDMPKEIETQLQELNLWMAEKNYALMEKNIASRLVPDVSLEFVETGKATVFDCIFTQIYGADFYCMIKSHSE